MTYVNPGRKGDPKDGKTYIPESQVWEIVDNMIEVESMDVSQFNRVRTILRRVGLHYEDKKIIQQCHIFKKRNCFFIAHYKQLLNICGKNLTLTERDYATLAKVSKFLRDEGMVDILHGQSDKMEYSDVSLKILLKTDIENGWSTITKYVF